MNVSEDAEGYSQTTSDICRRGGFLWFNLTRNDGMILLNTYQEREASIRLGAIEVGGTRMVCAIGDETGRILEKTFIPTTTPEETREKLVADEKLL